MHVINYHHSLTRTIVLKEEAYYVSSTLSAFLKFTNHENENLLIRISCMHAERLAKVPISVILTAVVDHVKFNIQYIVEDLNNNILTILEESSPKRKENFNNKQNL